MARWLRAEAAYGRSRESPNTCTHDSPARRAIGGQKGNAMKKIIGGRIYDTTTARELGSYTPDGLSSRDFAWFRETLYQKRTGEFYLYGEGNAASRYAKSAGQNCWGSGSKLLPLTYDAAREWAEDHLTADEYEEIFGAVSEDDTSTALNVQINSAIMARVRQAAAQEGVTLSSWVERALTKAFE
jgi:hypothetical protein